MSVLNLSDVNQFNDRFRFDAEFLKKEYLDIERKLEEKKFKRLVDIECKIIHPSEIKREYVESDGVWFFRTQNIRPLKIEESNDVFISKGDAKKLNNNMLKENDVVITRTGANYGQTALYNMNKTAIGSSHTFILRNEYFNQSYLAVYFNTKFGRKLINKGMYGGAQPEIAPYYLNNIPIPDFSISFQRSIEKVLKKSKDLIEQFKEYYFQAEYLLLEIIGLENFELTKEPTNIKSFKESFLATGRLDAEYYQKKYDDLTNKIISQNHKRIKDIRTDNFRGLQPVYVEDGGLNVINSKHILDKGLDYDNFEKTSAAYWEIQKKARVFKGDILTYTTGANIGRTQVYQIDEKALASNHVNIIRLKTENPFYIGFVLNSLIGRMQTEKFSAGSAQAELYPKDLDEFIIPIIEFEKQQQIASLVEKSFRLKAESERLLEVAKKAVEMAIEEGEGKAMEKLSESGFSG